MTCFQAQETYTFLNLYREMKALIEQQLLQKQQQQQQQASEQIQTFNNGEGLSEGSDYERLPIPLAFQSRQQTFYDEGSKEDTKRGSCKFANNFFKKYSRRT